jgi:prepilin-type N-terminal cleavage/methylation domain-containing protein
MAFRCNKIVGNRGFTMLEVLISVLIVSLTAVSYLMWQKTTWTETRLTNLRMLAAQVVEKQIEWRRMIIAQNPTANYSAYRAIAGSDTVMTDTTVTPHMRVEWSLHPDSLRSPTGDTIHNVTPTLLTASWGAGVSDTFKLWTNITKNF